MVEIMQHFLWDCHRQYRQVGMVKYRRDFDWKAIEKQVHQLGLIKKRKISYEDLSFFNAEALWPFEEFSSLPPKETITASLQDKTFNFEDLPQNEARLIRNLLKVVRSIELVSVILRFVKPEDYGIISPPVEKILEVRRGENVVKTYRNYLQNLRQIKEELRFSRVADVDMALWVLYNKCFGSPKDPDLRRNYLHDKLLRNIRIKNLVSPLPLDKLSNAQLAEALQDVKPALSALIACYELETLIRKFAELTDLNHEAPDSQGYLPPLSEIINGLASKGCILRKRAAIWRDLKDVRDRFFHRAIEPGDKTSLLVEEVSILEQDIAALQFESNLKK